MALFELNTKYTVTTPVGLISDYGVRKIMNVIRDVRTGRSPWLELNPDKKDKPMGHQYLPYLDLEEWDWRWLVEGKGEYVGTLPKRLSKYFYKEAGIRCPPAFLTEIGNIARTNTLDSHSYTFDITDNFHWTAGDFGDDGSCFFGWRSHCRGILRDMGCLAARFYSSAEANASGIARSWMQPAKSVGMDCWVFFNGYGLQRLSQARIFAQFANLSYKRVMTIGNGDVDVNNSHNFLVGDVSMIDSWETYDFGYPYESGYEDEYVEEDDD